jgi:hypothetical protein
MSEACLCECGQRFADEFAFDAHRPSLPERGISLARYQQLVEAGKRRCLDPRENLRRRSDGVWETPRRGAGSRGREIANGRDRALGDLSPVRVSAMSATAEHARTAGSHE